MSADLENHDAGASGELRAFVGARMGGYSWVVDLLPDYDLTVGAGSERDVRIELPNTPDLQATLRWSDGALSVVNAGEPDHVLINGEPVDGSAQFGPGDEIQVGMAVLVVNITLAPHDQGRRSLTHTEFYERVGEELSRASRASRTTCLMMLKSKSGDGSRLATVALDSFRAGDIVGTYAHDEIEFLLPDTPPSIARAVVLRMIERAGAAGAHVGMAVAPLDGDTAERLLRSGRDALMASISSGEPIVRAGLAADVDEEGFESQPHTEATKRVVAEVTAAAEAQEPALLIGEASSGKRHFARLYHEKSERADGPVVVIQCPALVDRDSLHRAFGSAEDVEGCTAESAAGGTLVLDEIGDLPLAGQRSLLQLFEEGSEDYNIVATTHRDLSALCNVGAFQRALYEKVAARRIEVPALRMRAGSIVPLARNFAQQFGKDQPVKLSEGAIEKMRAYQWPGNVLELRNAMERAMALADGGEILAEHLPGDATDTGEGRLREHVGSVERDAIIKALADNNYNQTHAAKLLGISRRALIYKMEKYGLKPPPAGGKKRD